MRKEYKFKISVSGTIAQVDAAIVSLDTLALTGSEPQDRLLIQQAIDQHNLRASILYDHNLVWPFKRLMKEFRRYDKCGSIEKLSNFFYDFLYLGCDDIAHYNKNGYIEYYDGNFPRVKHEVIFASRVPGWHTDLQHVLTAMRQADEAQQPDTDDSFLDEIDPAQIRAKLAKSGIVDGQVVDPAALDNDPFIRMVERDVAHLAEMEQYSKKHSRKKKSSGYEQLSLFGRSA